MPPQGQTTPNSQTTTNRPSYQELVKQVTQRVWELWQRDIRREQERRGQIGKH